MNKKVLGAVVLGFAALGVSTAASAHVDVAVGLGIPVAPVYEAPPPPPPPVVVAQAPVVVGYGGYGPDWRERREWREREWRRREWREHEWREHHDRDWH
jgi:hypothetical protein